MQEGEKRNDRAHDYAAADACDEVMSPIDGPIELIP